MRKEPCSQCQSEIFYTKFNSYKGLVMGNPFEVGNIAYHICYVCKHEHISKSGEKRIKEYRKTVESVIRNC